MVWLISKSHFKYFIGIIFVFIFVRSFSSPTSVISSNYQCKTQNSRTNRCCTVVITDRQGRLGNRMFLFASAIGIAMTYSCKLAVDKKILDDLKTVFSIDLKNLSELQLLDPSSVRLCANRIYNYCNYFPLKFEKNRYHTIELTGFWQSYKYFFKYAKLVKSQFTFKESIKNKIAQYFYDEEQKYISRSTELYQKRAGNTQLLSFTWIGIHIRRGDFLYLRQISSKDFIDAAMYYFEKKYSNAIFLIASDDKTVCKEMYGNRFNVIITPVSFSTGEDLAALATCNHMIVTVGTFGWWAGFLVAGEVLHDIRFSENPTPIDNNCTRNNYLPPSFSYFNKTF